MEKSPKEDPESAGDHGHSGEPRVPPNGDPEPDQAWKALSLVNDWIKHADAKVGATLAATGAVAILLYNLLKEQTDPSFLLTLLATGCALTVAAAGGCAGVALAPRLTIVSRIAQWKASRAAQENSSSSPTDPEAVADCVGHDKDEDLPPIEDPINLLFFSNIATQYDGDGPTYVEVFRSLTSDPERLTRQIAHQVHANATVAHRKFAWADRGIKFLTAALLLLGLVAITLATQESSGQEDEVREQPHRGGPPWACFDSDFPRTCEHGMGRRNVDR